MATLVAQTEKVVLLPTLSSWSPLPEATNKDRYLATARGSKKGDIAQDAVIIGRIRKGVAERKLLFVLIDVTQRSNSNDQNRLLQEYASLVRYDSILLGSQGHWIGNPTAPTIS